MCYILPLASHSRNILSYLIKIPIDDGAIGGYWWLFLDTEAAQFIMTTTAAAAARPRAVNPYAKPTHNAVVNDENMGRQSQQRVSNQHKRKFKLASKAGRRKGDQLTLDNNVAFDSIKDCKVCKAKHIQGFMPTYTIPKRAHHVLCPKNKKNTWSWRTVKTINCIN